MSHYAGATSQAQLWADERDTHPPFENCVAASGVNIAGAATGGHTPTTDAEVQALRKATGDTVGGETLIDLRKGMLARYGWSGTLDESWETIATGLVSGAKWFAVIGDYDAAPIRVQASFHDFHCVAIGPHSTTTCLWIDPLDKSGPGGHPRARVVSIAAVRKFCATYSYGSLGIVEYSHAPKRPRVSVSRGLFFLYDDHPWRRSRRLTGGFSAPCTAPVTELVMGERRPMVQLLAPSGRRGHWLATNESHIHYTEA